MISDQPPPKEGKMKYEKNSGVKPTSEERVLSFSLSPCFCLPSSLLLPSVSLGHAHLDKLELKEDLFVSIHTVH